LLPGHGLIEIKLSHALYRAFNDLMIKQRAFASNVNSHNYTILAAEKFN